SKIQSIESLGPAMKPSSDIDLFTTTLPLISFPSAESPYSTTCCWRSLRWRRQRASLLAARRKDAELVPFWVGKYDPALIALADVGVPGSKAEQSTDLFVLLPVGRVDVDVEPVLDRLALGDARERQSRRHRARAVLALRHRRRADRDNAVLLVLHLVVKDRAPEPRESAGIGTVDLK